MNIKKTIKKYGIIKILIFINLFIFPTSIINKSLFIINIKSLIVNIFLLGLINFIKFLND